MGSKPNIVESIKEAVSSASRAISENPEIDESFVYKTERKTKGVDFAFGFHAFSGLFWLLTAWVQMSLLKTSKSLHRMFGVVAIISFSMHMVASLYNLYLSLLQIVFLTGNFEVALKYKIFR